MLTLAFDPEGLGTASMLGPEIARLAEWVRASPPMAGCGAISLPGEPEHRTAAIRARDGIPMPRRTLDSLNAVARTLRVDTLT
jgi:LDH2 family malate/lactate/ureidoglycolate dehydrogenase